LKTSISILFILLVFDLHHVLAQASPPYQACFDGDSVAFKKRGCAPLNVKMINCSGGTTVPGHPAPHYIYGDGSGETPSTTHTYNTPGKYTVTQIVVTDDPSPTGPTLSTLVKVGYIEVLDTPTPNFKILNCINKEVKVQNTDADYDKYVIDWNDGSLKDTINGNSLISHIYATTTTKNIAVTGIYIPAVAGCNSATITTPVTPIQNLVKPDMINLIVNRKSTTNGQITLTLNAAKDQKYYLDQRIGAGPYTTIDSLAVLPANSVVSIPVNNLNTLGDSYCYRFRSFDDCGNTVLSEEICSTILNATAQNNQNLVTFNNIGASVGSYTLYKNGVVVPGAASPYIDSPVTCGAPYCYLVVTNLTTLTGLGSPMQSISDDSCVTAISTDIPPAVQNLTSSVSGNSINLTWDVAVFTPAVTQYTIRRSDGKISTSNTNSFTDNGVNANTGQYCYVVYYTPCTVTSLPSYTTCPVLLSGTETAGVNLSWTPYNICPSGTADYTVERLDPNTNAVTSSVPVGSSVSFTDNLADPDAVSLKYRIVTTCPTGTPSYSNIFEINHELKLFLPDAFTPDGDGNNDVFFAKGKYVKDFKMTIFNRWGEIVFFSDQFSIGWDGKYKGEVATMDAYAYMVEATDKFGNKLTRKGTVTLLR
jgi:gliding motility-associated-like protein